MYTWFQVVYPIYQWLDVRLMAWLCTLHSHISHNIHTQYTFVEYNILLVEREKNVVTLRVRFGYYTTIMRCSFRLGVLLYIRKHIHFDVIEFRWDTRSHGTKTNFINFIKIYRHMTDGGFSIGFISINKIISDYKR